MLDVENKQVKHISQKLQQLGHIELISNSKQRLQNTFLVWMRDAVMDKKDRKITHPA